jgi:uncharacterized OB-fold protein
MATGWGVDCDEVHQNLFIGDKVKWVWRGNRDFEYI